jgi:23S rRNA pseudouridine2605 synthase
MMKKNNNSKNSSSPKKAPKKTVSKDNTRSDFSVRKSKPSEASYKERRFAASSKAKDGTRKFDTDKPERKSKSFDDKKSGTFGSRDKADFAKDKPSFSKDKKVYTKDKPSFSKDSTKKFAPAGRQKRNSDIDKSTPRNSNFKKDDFKSKKEFAPKGASDKVYDVEANKKSYDNIGKRNRTATPKSFNPNYRDKNAAPQTFKKKELEASSSVEKKQSTTTTKKSVVKSEELTDPNIMRLNRYLAHSGVASRRKADELIEAGKVKVNGKVVIEPGTKWNKGDKVTFEGKLVEPQQLVYILLNKPKNTIATNSDEKGRKTVFEHIDDKLAKLGMVDLRLFTVGRLDRNSLGVLLITNDGDLAQDLTHPSKEVEKIYQVQLDKNVTPEDMEALATGITLEDGFIHCDKIAYVHELAKDEVGVEIHSGKNRIVRRMFEHLGYNVIKLDRVSFAGLTKKDLPRGKWRFLKENEIRQLKHFNNKPKKSSQK